MKIKLSRTVLVAFLALGMFWCARSATAQGQPGMVPGTPGIEPPRLQPVPPKIPPDFQEPPGAKKELPKRVFDRAKAHQEAFEISFLANQIPDEVDKLNKNILPKDLIQKLKRIEKLSKQLRTQLTQ
ncbi:MAG TPA: hypothetical protein VFM21_03950 [Terriglobia bacterium]|nr:hypothetical protein [Terriglobia bacterium]